MVKNESKQSGKGKKRAPAAGKKGGVPKKPVDPTKSVLRLPTPTTLRKEAGATADEIANSDPKAARKYGKEKVKELYAMVDADWHDGYEDKTDRCFDYFKGFATFAGPALSLSVQRGAAFERCHEVMRQLADSWENMQSIPTRFCIVELFSEADWETCTIAVDGLAEPLKFFTPATFFSEFWPVLLGAAASREEIGDELLYRWMNDAYDYGAKLLDSTETSDLVRGVDEVKDASGVVTREAKPGMQAVAKGVDLKKGHKRLEKLFANRSLWEYLPSRKAHYNEKPAIDRRFFGPKHLRTRDFGSFSDSDGGYGWATGEWNSDDERDAADSSSSF